MKRSYFYSIIIMHSPPSSARPRRSGLRQNCGFGALCAWWSANGGADGAGGADADGGASVGHTFCPFRAKQNHW